jgi:hypothetical protein
MTFPGHSYDIHGHSLTSEDFAAARDLVCSAALQQRYLGGGSLHAPHEGRRPDGDGMDGPWLPCPTLEVSWLVTGLFRLPQTWPLATPRMSKIDRTTRDLEILQHPGLFFYYPFGSQSIDHGIFQ